MVLGGRNDIIQCYMWLVCALASKIRLNHGTMMIPTTDMPTIANLVARTLYEFSLFVRQIYTSDNDQVSL